MRSKLKIFLLALLILIICLFFRKKQKENFTTLTFTYPAGFMNHQSNKVTGVLGVFSTYSTSTYQRLGVTSDVGTKHMSICSIDNSGNNVSSILNNLESECFAPGMPIKNLLFIFKFNTTGQITYFLADFTVVKTNTSISGIENIDNPVENVQYYTFNGSYPDINDPNAINGIYYNGDVTVSYFYSSSCIVTGWSTYNLCTNTEGETCGEAGASGKIRKTRVLIPAISGTDCPNTLSGTSFIQNSVNCTLLKCPAIDCRPQPWIDSECVPNPSPGSPTCEYPAGSTSGTKIQTRTVIPSRYDGLCSEQDSITSQVVPCSLATCLPENCDLGNYVDDGECIVAGGPCGNGIGTKKQKQVIRTPARYDGTCNPGERNVPCTLPRGLDCPDPITNDTFMKILSSDYLDFSLLGLKPYNPGYSLSQKVFGKSIGTTFENMEDFKKTINQTSCG